jgi:hypothetical protein
VYVYMAMVSYRKEDRYKAAEAIRMIMDHRQKVMTADKMLVTIQRDHQRQHATTLLLFAE